MDGRKKICWISWENLMKPKILGGLGFRDVQIFNQALLGKIAWRIITNPDCLLSRILIGKYCHNASFLTTTLPSSSSHGWKEILKGRDLLIKHLGKTIRNGNTTNVWKDSWIQPTSDLRLAGPPAEEQQDLLVADLLSRETKEWNVAKINNLFPELFNYILCLRPSLTDAEDCFVWTNNKTDATQWNLVITPRSHPTCQH